MIILAPISVGELYDKITILQVKADKFNDPIKLKNVSRELKELLKLAAENVGNIPTIDHKRLDRLVEDLCLVNAELWDIEDGKRASEENKEFSEKFIRLARDVYLKNDRRAAIKRAINMMTGSTIIEEKSHKSANF